jgi:putative transposase
MNTLDSTACMEALNEALERYGNPEIFNTDQGRSLPAISSQEYLRAERFLSVWTAGAGRWPTSLGYGSIPEARSGLEAYYNFYNNRRYHQSLDYGTPAQDYLGVEARGSQPSAARIFEGFDNFTLGRA